MKWIGQNIWEQISRFRDDVYLEDISTGTIASGGNLGLDSNNKIVKATEATGDITGVALTASDGIDITSVSGATGGAYEATIAVDVSDFMADGADNRLITAIGADSMQAEEFLTFANNSNISRLTLLSNQDTGDTFTLNTTTHGATSLVTTDDDGANANLSFDIDGLILLEGAKGVEIQNASSTAAAALLIDNDDTDQVCLDLEAANIDAAILRVKAPDLTTANAIYVNADSLTTGSGFKLDVDDALTASATKSLLMVDYDKAGVTASGQTSLTTGLNINMADGATNSALGTVTMVGAQIDVDSANAQGTITQKGLILNVAADGVTDTGTTSGIEMEVADGGTDIKMMSHADTADFCTIATTTNGATKITTVDGGAAAAHFEIEADGDLTLDAAGKIISEADIVRFDSDQANDPLVIIKNSANDATSGRLRFLNNRGADGQDNDETGIIEFYSYDDGTPTGLAYSQIKGTIHDATNTEESGKLQVQVASHDGGMEDGLVLTGGSADAEVDVTIGNGAASVTTVTGTLTMGSTATINNSGVVQVAAQTVIDHDQLANFAANEHFTQANITTVGTVGTGTWEGTAIATDQQKHVMHYFFKGYGTGDGTNYEIPVLATDNQAPWEHNTSTGSDGLTAITVQNQLRTIGTVMPRACTLKKWTGWTTCSGTSGTANIALFKLTPVANDNSTVSLVLLDNVSYTPLGNAKSVAIAETSFTASAIAAGDIVITGIKTPSGATAYFTSTIEVEF